MHPSSLLKYRDYIEEKERCVKQGTDFVFTSFGEFLRTMRKRPSLMHVPVGLDRRLPFEAGDVGWMLSDPEPGQPVKPKRPPRPPRPKLTPPCMYGRFWTMVPGIGTIEGSPKIDGNESPPQTLRVSREGLSSFLEDRRSLPCDPGASALEVSVSRVAYTREKETPLSR